MMTSNSMQITTEVTVGHIAPLSYCDSSVSNTTVRDVHQGVVLTGCRWMGKIKRGV